MQFKNVYLGRRSIRKYKNKEVPLATIGEIIDLAEFAPSSGNLQNWKCIVVTDQAKRQEIADACVEQNWMIEAPVFLVICNDHNDVKNHYGKLGRMYSIQNCANLAFGITLIAYDYGLASCWVGAFDNEAVQRILGIPEEMDPEIIITLGYSDEIKKPSLREEPNYIAYFNSWGKNFTEFPSHLQKLKNTVKRQINKIKKK
ncbi:MAG: nitroreductase [archaeon GW2011_AR17]|nr:MAG: nitroreductase [archaeon GW2011_AR17]MBS3154012.1 nitroreductase family protein [Candidatus Woesearchaeota archaeon]HIH15600.1 nitroreductase family protein [Nanoarchaeota archaeon]HIH59070.1 nitroreductase family protein [Nanoarchaeota archaeon]HII14643.1 nitroreductase family protein [Nanoarchaeota archaeon]